MASLTLRHLARDLLRSSRAAAQSRRTLRQEIVELLQEALSARPQRPAARSSR
jgi:hypothetical protein